MSQIKRSDQSQQPQLQWSKGEHLAECQSDGTKIISIVQPQHMARGGRPYNPESGLAVHSSSRSGVGVVSA
jgi:hypothetical protein